MQPNSNLAIFRRRLVRWFELHGRSLPWRGTHDPYRILVSEIMLQQTQVATVLGYYERWLERFPDFAALAAAEESEVLHAWQGLGYYSRARNLHRTAKVVVAEHGGVFPGDLNAIRRLPGIGRYTAGAVATFAHNRATPIVDANIARVVARLFAIAEPIDSRAGCDAVWAAADSLLPKRGAGRFNAALMELGALVCAPRKPGCARCPVHEFCAAESPESLPVKKPRRRTVLAEERVAFVTRNGEILLLLESGRRWRGLWRLPSVEIPAPGNRPLLTRLRYPITHHMVTLEVVPATPDEVVGETLRWFPIEDAGDVPMPSPHRRALAAILAGHESGMIAQRMM